MSTEIAYDVDDFLSPEAAALESNLPMYLKIAKEEPDVIPFLLGLVGEDTIPKDELEESVHRLFKSDTILKDLNYGSVGGTPGFKDTIRKKLLEPIVEEEGISLKNREISIWSSSQQALSAVAFAFGVPIFPGHPYYIGAKDAALKHGRDVFGLQLEDDGPSCEALIEYLERFEKEGRFRKSRGRGLFYSVPNFDNPTGRTTSREKRECFYEIAERHNLAILEDDPYGGLRFEGDPIASIINLDQSERTMLLRTFSKEASLPGLRLAWMVADRKTTDMLLKVKGSEDLGTSPFIQGIANEFLLEHHVPDIVDRNIPKYKRRRDLTHVLQPLITNFF